MSLRPETFEDELQRRLGRDYRLRWSPRKETWMIEQKVGRQVDLPRRFQWTDDWVRLRDGYGLVAEVSPALTMKCWQCRTRLAVPELAWKEVKCETCRASRNYNTSIYYVAYFPLCERLLQHLESTSPQRGWEWVKKLKSRNEQVREKLDQHLSDHLTTGLSDVANVIGDVPRVGYGSGPTRFGRV